MCEAGPELMAAFSRAQRGACCGAGSLPVPTFCLLQQPGSEPLLSLTVALVGPNPPRAEVFPPERSVAPSVCRSRRVLQPLLRLMKFVGILLEFFNRKGNCCISKSQMWGKSLLHRDAATRPWAGLCQQPMPELPLLQAAQMLTAGQGERKGRSCSASGAEQHRGMVNGHISSLGS